MSGQSVRAGLCVRAGLYVRAVYQGRAVCQGSLSGQGCVGVISRFHSGAARTSTIAVFVASHSSEQMHAWGSI